MERPSSEEGHRAWMGNDKMEAEMVRALWRNEARWSGTREEGKKGVVHLGLGFRHLAGRVQGKNECFAIETCSVGCACP